MDILQCARESQERWERAFADRREPIELGRPRQSLGDRLDNLGCAVQLFLSERTLSFGECAYSA